MRNSVSGAQPILIGQYRAHIN